MENFGNDFGTGYVEHLVKLQEKSVLLSKYLKLTGLFVLLLALIIGLSFLPLPDGVIPILFVGALALLWYLSRFVSVEYEYTILDGEITFEVIYGKTQRRHFYTVPRGKIEKIAPVNGKNISPSNFHGVNREVFCASRRDGENTYYAIVREEGGEKTLLFFEMTPKAEKALKMYYRSAFSS